MSNVFCDIFPPRLSRRDTLWYFLYCLFFPIEEYQREPRKDLLKLIYSLIFFLQCLFSHTIKKRSILVSRFQRLASWETCAGKQTQSTHTHTQSVITGLLQSTGCCVTSAPPHNKENGRVAPDKRRRSIDGGGDNKKDRIGSLETQPWLCRFPAETIRWELGAGGGFHFYNCQ